MNTSERQSVRGLYPLLYRSLHRKSWLLSVRFFSCQFSISGEVWNIFCRVKFLPGSSDNVLLSCAADSTVRMHDVNYADTVKVFPCHVNRAKRLAVSLDSPSIFWSAGEDGLILQYDLREPSRCDSHHCYNILINLNVYMASAEAKSIACNPVRPHYLAVGASDCFTRLYDRRMLRLQTLRYVVEDLWAVMGNRISRSLLNGWGCREYPGWNMRCSTGGFLSLVIPKRSFHLSLKFTQLFTHGFCSRWTRCHKKERSGDSLVLWAALVSKVAHVFLRLFSSFCKLLSDWAIFVWFPSEDCVAVYRGFVKISMKILNVLKNCNWTTIVIGHNCNSYWRVISSLGSLRPSFWSLFGDFSSSVWTGTKTFSTDPGSAWIRYYLFLLSCSSFYGRCGWRTIVVSDQR